MMNSGKAQAELLIYICLAPDRFHAAPVLILLVSEGKREQASMKSISLSLLLEFGHEE
jgi:hypothetical protein